MKKALLLLALCVFAKGNAQVSFKPGLKAGYSATTITGYNGDYRNNFYVGTYGLLKLSKVYNMQFEILYLRQGVDNFTSFQSSSDGSGGQIMRQTNVPLDYLSLNFVNKFNFDKFNLFVGPGIDIKVSEQKINADDYNSGYYNEIYSNNSDIDLTINIGLGYNITEQFGIEARMRQGLIEPIYGNGSTYNNSSSHQNRSFLIGLNYTFK